MRFIFNFILFGILFYLLWLYFPEQFEILKSWAASVVDLFKQLYHQLMERLHTAGSPPPPPVPPAG